MLGNENAIGDNASIKNETDKIDKTVPLGLTGVENSLSYYAAKLNGHFHNYERWLVKASVPNGEIHVADQMLVSSTAFQANGGNNTWGAWIQIIGSSDMPIQVGMLKFDMHRFLITAYERFSTIYKIQIAVGTSGAAALAAGTYTEFPIITLTGIATLAPFELMNKGISPGEKVWVRVWAVGQISGTLDFYIGLHEYVG